MMVFLISERRTIKARVLKENNIVFDVKLFEKQKELFMNFSGKEWYYTKPSTQTFIYYLQL